MFGLFPQDADGAIIPDGMDSPQYLMDCMAYGYLEDKTGRWNQSCVPPPREYFNCLRFITWQKSNFMSWNGYPKTIRDINLKPSNEISRADHTQAMHMAYGLWAEDVLARMGVQQPPSVNYGLNLANMPMTVQQPPSINYVPAPSNMTMGFQQPSSFDYAPAPSLGNMPMYGSMQLPPPIRQPGSGFETFVSPKPVDFPASPDPIDTTYPPRALYSRSSDESSDPTAANYSRGGRVDSAMFSNESSSISPTLTWRDGHDESPTHRPERRPLSALAPAFNFNSQGNPPLSSKDALPQSAGQLPGTFDIVSKSSKSFTILRISDSPFNVTVNEILTHLKLGEREGLVNYGPDNPAIHIIQDRADSKTHEVYVEMLDFQAAQRVISDIPKRGLKVGSTGSSRKIKVDIVSREAMIKAVFPRPIRTHPRDFKWIGDQPDVSSIPDPFIGYVTSEDLHNAREWAEHPRKV